MPARFSGLMMYMGAVALVTPPSLSGARLIFSCGWHITLEGQDVLPRRLRWTVGFAGMVGKLSRAFDIDDQAEASRLVFAGDREQTRTICAGVW